MLSVAAVVVILALSAGLARADDETLCLRPRNTGTLTNAVLLKDHIVGVWTGRCSALNNCNGHGYCRPVTQTCVCHNGYGGLDDIYDYASPSCETRVCPAGRAWVDVPYSDSGAHLWRECSAKGQCDRATGNCNCFPGYTGSACQYASCPNDCSGRGDCIPLRRIGYQTAALPVDVTLTPYDNLACTSTWDQDAINVCVCDSSWPVGMTSGTTQTSEFFGPDCSKRHCPSGDDPLTTVNETNCTGKAHNGAVAGAGTTGNLCQVDCSNRGICDYRRGVCECFDGFYGPACSIINANAQRPNVLTNILP